MAKRNIRFRAAEDVREFVRAADRCDNDVDILFDEFTVDGKSILGVMSQDLTRELTIKYSESDKQFEQILDKFACA